MILHATQNQYYKLQMQLETRTEHHEITLAYSSCVIASKTILNNKTEQQIGTHKRKNGDIAHREKH